MAAPWYSIRNLDDIPSPALLVYPARVDANLKSMVSISGAPERLRPHIKTHKMPRLIERQLKLGITRFKCATIAEAEMAAASGAPDLLLAYQPVGPNIQRFISLIRQFPQTRFSTLADNETSLQQLSAAATQAGINMEVLLDIDCGMHRSGIAAGPQAHALYLKLISLPGLIPGGLHVYDGHLHERDVSTRRAASDSAFSPTRTLRDQLLIEGAPVPKIVAGGTPTFPFHAAREPFVECSPGTTVFWDAGYSDHFPDLDFQPAALLLTRVISKPAPNQLCLDLGHKAVAAENPIPKRVQLLDSSHLTPVSQSEEHLVVESDQADTFQIGHAFYGIPWHICPTVALYSEAVAVTHHQATERWPITARNRSLSI